VQFGEQLRGYPEFSITPNGFIDSTDTYQASRSSFGNAFFTTTAELGLRLNSSVYVNTFFDAGNVWRKATDFNPTRLFRGAGFGASVVTPLGPLGLDYAYGFDRTVRDPVTGIVRPAPKWQFHFRLGQLF
jgi:outer membrane protein insertion porin family